MLSIFVSIIEHVSNGNIPTYNYISIDTTTDRRYMTAVVFIIK